MRAKVLLLLSAALLVLGGAVFGEGKAETKTLTISVPWAGSELDQFLPVLQAYEKSSGVKVNYVTYRGEDLSSVLPAQFQAGQAPADLIFMWDWWIKQNAQFAEDLGSVWQPNASAMVANPVEASGKVVAVPVYQTAKPGFWYRKSFFQANGLQEPKTWQEFTDLLQKIGQVEGVKNPIVSGDGTGWPLSDVTEAFLIRFGGVDMVNGLISGQISFSDPAVQKVFTERLVPLLRAKAFSDPIEWTQAVDLWWDGQYGLYFMGNWITGLVEDPADLGVFLLPATDTSLGVAAAANTAAIVTGPDHAFIPNTSQNVDEAKKLLSFMLSAEGQRARAQAGGKLAVRRDIAPEAYPTADQAVARLVSSLRTTVADLDDSIGGDWQRLFWDQLKLLWVRPDSINDVLNRLQTERPAPAPANQ